MERIGCLHFEVGFKLESLSKITTIWEDGLICGLVSALIRSLENICLVKSSLRARIQAPFYISGSRLVGLFSLPSNVLQTFVSCKPQDGHAGLEQALNRRLTGRHIGKGRLRMRSESRRDFAPTNNEAGPLRRCVAGRALAV